MRPQHHRIPEKSQKLGFFLDSCLKSRILSQKAHTRNPGFPYGNPGNMGTQPETGISRRCPTKSIGSAREVHKIQHMASPQDHRHGVSSCTKLRMYSTKPHIMSGFSKSLKGGIKDNTLRLAKAEEREEKKKMPRAGIDPAVTSFKVGCHNQSGTRADIIQSS